MNGLVVIPVVIFVSWRLAVWLESRCPADRDVRAGRRWENEQAAIERIVRLNSEPPRRSHAGSGQNERRRSHRRSHPAS